MLQRSEDRSFEQGLVAQKLSRVHLCPAELSAQGNFKNLQHFDTIFRFQNI